MGAYQLQPNLSLGGLIDQADQELPSNYQDTRNEPTVGLFAAYSGTYAGREYTAKLSAAYNNENYKIENSFRFASSFLEYDNVAKTKHDDASSDSVEASYALKLLQDKGKLKNSLTYHKLHIERNTFGYTFANPTHSANYFGNRDALNYLGEYNFSLDNKIIFGVDSEFDSARSTESEHDENIISQYFDLQFRPFEKTYATSVSYTHLTLPTKA